MENRGSPGSVDHVIWNRREVALCGVNSNRWDKSHLRLRIPAGGRQSHAETGSDACGESGLVHVSKRGKALTTTIAIWMYGISLVMNHT